MTGVCYYAGYTVQLLLYVVRNLCDALEAPAVMCT